MSDRLIAYQTVPTEGYQLVTAPHGRAWMDETHERSAYRCLPLLMANQAGWMILNPSTVRVSWDGGATLGSTQIQAFQNEPELDASYCYPMSHFGVGIVTWTLPFLFRTPPGYNLLVRGPSNSVKDGIAPLEGIVETDWTPATFTVNWKITRPDTWIVFEKSEPIAMIVPQKRGQLEEFVPEMLPIETNPELQDSNERWCASRDEFNGSQKWKQGAWEKHYFQGKAPDGSVAEDHQTRLRLREFSRVPLSGRDFESEPIQGS